MLCSPLICREPPNYLNFIAWDGEYRRKDDAKLRSIPRASLILVHSTGTRPSPALQLHDGGVYFRGCMVAHGLIALNFGGFCRACRSNTCRMIPATKSRQANDWNRNCCGVATALKTKTCHRTTTYHSEQAGCGGGCVRLHRGRQTTRTRFISRFLILPMSDLSRRN